MEPRLEFAFETRLKLAPRLRLDNPQSGGARLSVPVLDGEFEGPRLRGRVLNHGGEFAHVIPVPRIAIHVGHGHGVGPVSKLRCTTFGDLGTPHRLKMRRL